MIRPGIEPISHVSPRKPVELNPRAAVTKTPHRAGEISEQHARVWDAVVSTATGSNISGTAPDITQVDGYNPAFDPAEWLRAESEAYVSSTLEYLAIRSAEFLRRAAVSEQEADASEPEGHVWGGY